MQHVHIRCRGVIVHEGKVLVVRHMHSQDRYAFPGGHLEIGEEPRTCIRRELFEELGIVPVVGRLLFVYTFIDGNGVQSIEFFFEITNGAEYLSHEDREKSHAHEIGEVKWCTSGDGLSVLPKEVWNLFEKGRLFNSGETLFLHDETIG